jgi:hypothetical protein
MIFLNKRQAKSWLTVHGTNAFSTTVRAQRVRYDEKAMGLRMPESTRVLAKLKDFINFGLFQGPDSSL